ncbi:MAG: TAXI family TRAP transporter solute-binding subunit [Candidatus Ozemobacteraceae bacterium]
MHKYTRLVRTLGILLVLIVTSLCTLVSAEPETTSPSLNPTLSPALSPSLKPALSPSLNPALNPSLNLSPSTSSRQIATTIAEVPIVLRNEASPSTPLSRDTLSTPDETTLTLARRFIGMGTASIDGSYYPLGAAMTGLFNSRLEGMVALAEPTAGSVANLEYLSQGDLALALVQSDMAYAAFHGREMFINRPFSQLRVLASLYPEVVHLVVRRDAGIDALSGLRGRRIALGEEGSGTALNAQRILEVVGLRINDFQPHFLSFTKATEALQAGDIDAVFFTGGIPSDGLSRLAGRIPIKLLAFPEEISARLLESQPFWGRETIPPGTYQGQSEPVPTVGLRALLVTTSDFDPGVATAMLELIFTHLEYLAEKSPSARMISLPRAREGIEPEMLHPAAETFFRQKGL